MIQIEKNKKSLHKPRRDTPWVLSLDQGGHASRALIIDPQGIIISQSEVTIRASIQSHPHANSKTLTHRPAHIEYNPEVLLASLQQVIQQVTEAIDIHVIQQVALATQRSNIICWDKVTGQALSPIISWQDVRAQQWLSEKRDQAEFVHNQTGLFLSAHYGASKLHWCMNHIEAVKQAYHQQRLAWGPMASWLVRQLCREHPLICDAVNASRTLLWSVHKKNWSPKLLRIFELPDNNLPDSVYNTYHFGTLLIKQHEIPLQLVSGDQAAALFAFGTPQKNKAYITVGTGAFVLNPCGHKPIIDEQLLTSLLHYDATGAQFALEGTVNGAGGALDDYARQFKLVDYLTSLPQWLEHCTNPPLFLNGYAGLGTPYMQADFPSQFIWNKNEDKYSDKNENQLVAIIESIVFLLHTNLLLMKKLNPTLKTIIIGGGLARFDGFCQRLADLSLPVIRPQQVETTCRGLAYLSFKNRGITFRTAIDTEKIFTAKTNPRLEDRYQQWTLEMKSALHHG